MSVAEFCCRVVELRIRSLKLTSLIKWALTTSAGWEGGQIILPQTQGLWYNQGGWWEGETGSVREIWLKTLLKRHCPEKHVRSCGLCQALRVERNDKKEVIYVFMKLILISNIFPNKTLLPKSLTGNISNMHEPDVCYLPWPTQAKTTVDLIHRYISCYFASCMFSIWLWKSETSILCLSQILSPI